MIRYAIAYLFGIHCLFWDQWPWLALTAVNAVLMLLLARRNAPSWFSLYMLAATFSSLFRYSPLWHTAYDAILAVTACLFGWSLVPAGSHRAFAVCIGVTLAGVLAAAGLEDWTGGYSAFAYRARIYAAVALMGVAAACVTEGWVREQAVNWRAVIAVAWFATMFLSLIQWRTDTGSHTYWVQRWHVALAGKLSACVCLVAWTRSSLSSEKGGCVDEFR